MVAQGLPGAFLDGQSEAVAEVTAWVRRAAAPFRRRLAFEWDDVVQQALTELTADLRAGRLHEPASLRGYVWRLTSHTCLDRLRRLRRSPFTPIAELDFASAEPSPALEASRRELTRRALALVASMPEACREIWTLIAEGLSYEQVSVRLAIRSGTLRVRALRCRRMAAARWRAVTIGPAGRRDSPGDARADRADATEEGVTDR